MITTGSGGYQSGDAFRVRGGRVTLLAHVEGLPAGTDLARALGARLRARGRAGRG